MTYGLSPNINYGKVMGLSKHYVGVYYSHFFYLYCSNTLNQYLIVIGQRDIGRGKVFEADKWSGILPHVVRCTTVNNDIRIGIMGRRLSGYIFDI